MRRFLLLLWCMVFIPYATTLAWTGQLKSGDGKTVPDNRIHREEGDVKTDHQLRMILVMRNGTEQSISVEEFLIHVLAAQIPAEFETETLKAQAILARTYIYGVMGSETTVREEELDMDALSTNQMQALWGEHVFIEQYAKLQNAIQATDGLYLLYDGKLIEPLYCYASTGMTRSRGEAYPYLKQTDSPSDISAENYRSLPVFSKRAFADRINSIPGAAPITEEQIPDEIQIVERDQAGYVRQVQIGRKIYTGEEVQYALDLNSPSFSFENQGENIRVICKGIGHGYGLSQFGANEMAKTGLNYEELLCYYFQNIEIVGN